MHLPRKFSVHPVAQRSFYFQINYFNLYGTSRILSREVSLLRKSTDVQHILESFILGLENATSKEMYKKSSQKMEKWSKIFHMILIRVLMNISFSSMLIMSLVAYYTTDAKEEALKLPVTFWSDFKCSFKSYMYYLIKTDFIFCV